MLTLKPFSFDSLDQCTKTVGSTCKTGYAAGVVCSDEISSSTTTTTTNTTTTTTNTTTTSTNTTTTTKTASLANATTS